MCCIIADLKKQHGELYTAMQYRIWSKMKVAGLHNSLTDPPFTSMFVCAGGSAVGNKKSNNDTASLVLTQLTLALVPKPSSSRSDSPGKIIENRSKCYRQLGELKNLWESRLLSEDEYTRERESIMSTLKNISGNSQ